MKEIIRAEYSGFCFGVDRAVNQSFSIQKHHGKSYTLGPLIHNADVTEKLRLHGVDAISVEDVEKLNAADTVIIRTHGVGPTVYDALQRKDVHVLDLTCPYVQAIQRKVKMHHEKGYRIVILGDANHPEVQGINGYAEGTAIITKTGLIENPLKGRLCLVAQTTEKQENWLRLVRTVAAQAKEFVAFNTICKATEERQKSATELSKEVDVMIVIGGKSSSNTMKLYEICKSNCARTYHIENAKGLEAIKKEIKDAEKIGVTAGASTPEWIIKEAMENL